MSVSCSPCYAIVLPGRKSALQAAFRPDFSREGLRAWDVCVCVCRGRNSQIPLFLCLTIVAARAAKKRPIDKFTQRSIGQIAVRSEINNFQSKQQEREHARQLLAALMAPNDAPLPMCLGANTATGIPKLRAVQAQTMDHRCLM